MSVGRTSFPLTCKQLRKEKIMNKTRSTQTTLTAIFLTICIVVSTLAAIVPSVNAQTLQNYPTFVFVGASPDPVGLGQTVTIVTWTAEMPPDVGETAGTVAGGRAAWEGITVTLTKPDGSNQTLALPRTDPVGGTYYVLTPDQLGTYTVQAHFPAQWKNTTTYNRLYASATSAVDQFTVTETQLQIIPGVPLPNEYWTRPINAYNREWYVLGGNWLGDGRGNLYTTGPETAHIVWTKPLQNGGITGGEFEDISYYEGTSYEQRFSHPVIINGILFYTQPLSHRDYHSRDYNTMSGQEVVAVDLRTGKEIWRIDNAGIQMGMLYEYYSPNQHGLHGYLWRESGTTWIAYDPSTGAMLFNITNVPSGTNAIGPNGERLRYVIGGSSTNRTSLALWNSTAIPSMLMGTSGTSYWQWRPAGYSGTTLPRVHNGSQGYSWNVSLPAGLAGNVIFTLEDRIIGGSGFASNGVSQPNEQFTIWAVRTDVGHQGELLFNIKPRVPAANVTLQFEGSMVSDASLEAGVFTVRAKETRQWIGFDIDTGEQLWITESQNDWMMYSRTAAVADGKLFSGGYGGVLYAYDLQTGDLLWNATTDTSGLDSPYDRYPINSITYIDGKVYINTGEHSHTQPYYKGWSSYVFDAETGDRLWDMTGIWRAAAFADGYMATANLMDMQVYVFGKGPTKTSVEVKSNVMTKGNSVVITGSVMDISGGTTDSALTARFPNGVPAVSDDSMTAWMKYVYMQLPKPADVKGVTVTLNVIDANGNYRPIGETTSDASGMFSYTWEPDIEGDYKVVATFGGSESYFPSSAETAFFVDEAAPQETDTPTVALPPTELYFVASTAAIIIAIAIVGLLLLRKRP